MRVERVQVDFGKRASGLGALAGYPSRTERLNVGILPKTTNLWVAAPAPFGTPANFENTTVPVNAPRRAKSDGPICAIGIAPDSPLECVDLYLGGQTPFRIGPGSPYIGEIEEDTKILAAPCRNLPPPIRRDFMVGTISGDTQLAETCFWEMQFQPQPVVVGIPVRLDIYRGNAVEVAELVKTRRGRYTADLAWEITDRGGAVPSVPALVMIVDGRRRIRVVSGRWAGAGGGNLHVYGLEGRPGYLGDRNTVNNPEGTLDWPVFDELLAPTAIAQVPDCTIYDYPGTGCPYYALLAQVEGGAIGQRGFTTIHAWDE